MGRNRQGRKKSVKRGPTCEICGREATKTTEEHAYPAWLLRHTRESFRNPPPDFVPAPGWEQDSKVVLKRVCLRCQRLLNCKFETPARGLITAILDGSILDLSPRDQVVLAAWFCKTAIVLALAREQRSADPRLTPQERARLRETLQQMLSDGQPPRSAVVRIAQRSLVTEPSQWGLVPPPRLDEPFLVTSVYSFENILCEVIVDAHPTTIARHTESRDLRFIVLRTRAGIEPVHWPPPSPVAYPDVSVLSREWGHDPERESRMLPLIPTRAAHGDDNRS
jgi:hypothetical protein